MTEPTDTNARALARANPTHKQYPRFDEDGNLKAGENPRPKLDPVNGRFVDDLGRDADRCRTDALHAGALVSALLKIALAAKDGLWMGRAGGAKALARLERTAVVFERVASRDNALADELDALAREDAL